MVSFRCLLSSRARYSLPCSLWLHVNITSQQIYCSCSRLLLARKVHEIEIKYEAESCRMRLRYCVPTCQRLAVRYETRNRLKDYTWRRHQFLTLLFATLCTRSLGHVAREMAENGILPMWRTSVIRKQNRALYLTFALRP